MASTPPPTQSNTTLYVPDFILPYWNDEALCLPADGDLLMEKDWLTPELVEEIDSLCPKDADIDRNNDNCRSEDAFNSAVTKFYTTGRVFASFKQLHQASDRLLMAWAVKISHHSKAFRCFYHRETQTKSKKHNDPSRHRDTKSIRSEVDCPFKISYSFVKYSKKHNIFHKVKLTSMDLTHTHALSTTYQRQAIVSSGHCRNLKLHRMNDIVRLVSNHPTTSAKVLRPLITDYLPHYTSVDSKLLSNIKRKALAYFIKHGERELTMDEANAIAKPTSAADEITFEDNPFCRANLSLVLRKSLSDSSEMWDTEKFLKGLKQLDPMLDYRIKNNSISNLPEGVCWMLGCMKRDVSRYGDIISLDAQKRQYNTLNWVYIAPCLKDNDMKVRVGAESLLVEESNEMYVWVLQAMAEMETSFRLSNIKIVFGDQKISTTILSDLGIYTTCVLRGDYYHLINKVWPRPENFGNSFSLIHSYLQAMLCDPHEENWHLNYRMAREALSGNLSKIQKLDEIYSNPEYYAGYRLRQIVGNLGMQGSVSSEQNHSSVVSYLGKGTTLSINWQVQALVERTLLKEKERNRTVSGYRVQAESYTSKLSGQAGITDTRAKLILSRYAYETLFLPQFRKARKMTTSNSEDDMDMVTVQPTNPTTLTGLSSVTEVTFKKSEGCSCSFRITHDIPCAHELCAFDLLLQEEKINPRWFNQNEYDLRFPRWKDGCRDWRTTDDLDDSFVNDCTDDSSSVGTNSSIECSQPVGWY